MAAVYEALTKRQKLFVMGGAFFTVFVSLLFAAWIMQDALRSTQFSQQDQEVVNQILGDTKDPQHKAILRAQAIDAVANLKQLAMRQSILIAAFAGAFALSAVGFALFLLGADGVFQIQAEQGRGGIKLLLAGTAPGIACFVLAVILLGVAIAHRSSVDLAPVNFPRQVMGTLDSPAPRLPAGADTASNTEAPKAKAAADMRDARREAGDRAAETGAAARLAAEKVAAEKVAAEKVAAEKMAAQKAAAQKLAAEKLIADKSAAAKFAAEKLAVEKAAIARLAAAKAKAEKLAAEKATDARLTADKRLADKAAASKLAAEKAAPDRTDIANLTAERIAAAGEPSAIYKRAVALRIEGETGQALALLRYASSNGHGPSSRLLATIYRDGAPDVRADFRQAERYQALADAQGGR